MRHRVFITQPVAASAIARLQGIAKVEWNDDPTHIMTRDELIEVVRNHDILFCLLSDRVDADVIGASRSLSMIATMKITPSDIDVAAATARRIPVTVVPPIVTEATADLHFAILLAVARRVVEGDKLLREGIFPGAQSMRLMGAAVWGKTIGLVGSGVTEVREALANVVVDNIAAVIEGRQPPNCWNPEIYAQPQDKRHNG